MIAMVLAALAATSGANDDPLVTFRDWTVGCDNGRSCMAVGQFNTENLDLASVVVERGPLAGDGPRIWFRNDGGKVVDLAADGKRLGVKLGLDADDINVVVDPASVPTVIAAMISARTLVPVRADGERTFPLSISGASAALRWMDSQQHRAGTVTALVAKGPASASSIPLPPPLPTVPQAVPSGPLAKRFTDAEVRAIQEDYAECSDDDLHDRVEYSKLDARTTLAVVTAVCGSGAYNYFGIPLLLRDGAKPELAKFEDRTGEDGDMPMNLSWDATDLTLSSYFKGRGLGDCGAGTDWVWDGAMFRTIEDTMLGECLGGIAWIPTYRARPVRR